MKKSLPANAKISKEAKETVQECVSEYVSFITGEASDKCQREKRKTINGDDLLWAMTILGFQNHVGPLRNYLGKYRETEVEKNSTAIQEDQSPTNSNTDHGLDEINTDRTNFMQTTADFLRFSSGSIPKSLGSQVGVTGYEENSVNIGASNFNRI